MQTTIVGASVAGVRVAQALRLMGAEGPISILGKEPHLPYDKPPLSKELLDPAADGLSVPLLSEAELAELDIELLLGDEAVGIDAEARTVRTASGRAITFTELVVATGMEPRTLPTGGVTTGVHTLRNIDDALALRAALPPSADVVIIGAGFIGAEVASAARAHGSRVTILESQAIPMGHVLGPEIGTQMTALHAQHGVTVEAGVQFRRFLGDGAVMGVALADGRVLLADLVVVGIGAAPTTGWLTGSGIDITDGVLCDDRLRIVGTTGMYAAGDVARWPHALLGSTVRIEHWTNATDHAAIIAADILGLPAPAPTVPYVWSDQYGTRLQIVGRPSLGTLIALRGTVGQGPVTAVYAAPDGLVAGVFVADSPPALMRSRRAIATGRQAADLAADLADL